VNTATVLWVALFCSILLLIWLLYRGVRACRRASMADWGSRTLNTLDGLNRLFCRGFHRLQHSTVVLPRTGAAIVACNHVSGLDPLLMVAACNRPLRFIIAKEEYDRWWLRWLYRRMRCIPVNRSRNPEKAFYAARQALNAGEVVAIFPQGAIRVAGAPAQPLKRGVVMLADLAKAPIIPMRLSGIKGTGMVIMAVFLRSRALLETAPAISVNGRSDKEALHRIEQFIAADPMAPLLAAQ